MLRAWSMRIASCILIAAVLATILAATGQAQSADEIDALNTQFARLYGQGNYAEAQGIAERALALAENALGQDHPVTLTSVNNLAVLYAGMGRDGEAELLYKRALEARERILGPEHRRTLASANNLAEFYRVRGRYGEAEPLYKRTLEASARVLGPEHPQTLASTDNLMAFYYGQGRYGEAEPLLRRALEARERILGPEHPETLTSVNNLAKLCHARGRFGEAEMLYKRALEARERVLGPEHPDTLTSVSDLAELHLSQGRYGAAEVLHKRALEARERLFGQNHPDTLTSVNNLAELYHAQARYSEAERLLKRALEGRERVLGPEHPDTLRSVNNLAALYQEQGRYSEAEPLYKRALETSERVLGKEQPQTLGSIHNLAALYREQGRNREAELLYKRALEASERVLGHEHPDTLTSINNLAGLYQAQGRHQEAEALHKRALEARERVIGKEHPDTLTSTYNLAALYYAKGRYTEAEALYLQALEASERLLGREHPSTLDSVNNLAVLYRDQGRYGEAERLYSQALEARERVLGPEHPSTLISVNALAGLYESQGRYSEAAPLYKRALEASERVLGKEHPSTLVSLNNLAEFYHAQDRYAEAEPLLLRALEARERLLGLDHPQTLTSVNNLAVLYRDQGRYGEAEPLHLRALAAREHTLGLEHPWTLVSVNTLAGLYESQGRYSMAEPLYKRALEARERVLGPEHPSTLTSMNDLAELYFAQSDWDRAVALGTQSTERLAKRSLRGALNPGEPLTGRRKSDAEQSALQFIRLVKAVSRLTELGRQSDAPGARATFRTAQWALSSEAANSLTQMAARGAKGSPELAALVRERQDLVAEWQNRDALRNAWLGESLDNRNSAAEAGNAAQLTSIDARVAVIDGTLRQEFGEYAALVSPEPLSVEEVQAQLGGDEALVLFLDTAAAKPTPEESFVWVVTKTDMRWVRSDLGKAALTREIQALRCGLDEEEWATPTNARRCADILGLTEVPDASRPLPFHLGKAHALYQALFGQIEDMIVGKRLLIVPSGALTSLPFHVLVTQAPTTALPNTFEGYRDVAWLGRTNAITTLPAVSSLKALRQHASNRAAATDTYAGYGNPLLSGDGGSCRVAKSPEVCPEIDVAVRPNALIAVPTTGSTESGRATVRGRGGRRSGNATTDEVFAKGSTPEALLAQVRGLCPLPDTEYEIKCVAKRFVVNASLIRLAVEAREPDIKALSKSGQLAQYRVLHFATHGLLSGDVEMMTKRQGEPALVLTPPDTPADADDDGLLMASEVAALKLNADWVVMSACNTAAGDKIGAQALSGLARAFFYAGGHALLVSHWPVYSDAAVRLTTSAFAELDLNPKAGRAEALRNAMIALIDDRSQADNTHPAVWAPFVVVGEGGR